MRTLHLQSIGKVPAIEAGELKAGMTTVWNWGETSVITEKIKETAKMITFKFESGYERRFLKTRLVAVK